MSQSLSIALVGVGGYGQIYASALLAHAAGRNVRFVAGVDTDTAGQHTASIRAAGIPIYTSLEDLYRHHRPDLVILASPIHYHAAHTLTALAHGSHVLCEKPLAATVEQGIAMRRARDHANRLVAIGYQWSFCPVIAALKHDIRAGLFGRPRQLRSLVLWPRDERYYLRNRWAGRQHCDLGLPVFDSPVNNAAAHYLHNMLFLLGDRADRAVTPKTVQAELHRANPIESYDTAALRCTTADGTTLCFFTSHAVRNTRGPVMSFEFDLATIRYSEAPEEQLVAHFHNGTAKPYGIPAAADSPAKLWELVGHIRQRTTPPCGIEAALPHAQVVEAAYKSSHGIHDFPKTAILHTGPAEARLTHVEGIEQALMYCYDSGALPSELELPWAVPGSIAQVVPVMAVHDERRAVASTAVAAPSIVAPIGLPAVG